jgi:hypothetical protein
MTSFHGAPAILFCLDELSHSGAIMISRSALNAVDMPGTKARGRKVRGPFGFPAAYFSA